MLGWSSFLEFHAAGAGTGYLKKEHTWWEVMGVGNGMLKHAELWN